MKKLFEVKFKHWWQWLIPAEHRRRRIIQKYVDAHAKELEQRLVKEYTNLLLYGCSVAPEEFYGKGIIDELGKNPP